MKSFQYYMRIAALLQGFITASLVVAQNTEAAQVSALLAIAAAILTRD